MGSCILSCGVVVCFGRIGVSMILEVVGVSEGGTSKCGTVARDASGKGVVRCVVLLRVMLRGLGADVGCDCDE